MTYKPDLTYLDVNIDRLPNNAPRNLDLINKRMSIPDRDTGYRVGIDYSHYGPRRFCLVFKPADHPDLNERTIISNLTAVELGHILYAARQILEATLP